MSLRKMQNARINLKPSSERGVDDDVVQKQEEGMRSEHQKKFEEKIKKFDQPNQEAAPDQPIVGDEEIQPVKQTGLEIEVEQNKESVDDEKTVSAEMVTDLRQAPEAAEQMPVDIMSGGRDKLPEHIADAKPKEYKTLKFPDNFLWGTSTSAYQVEGGNKNDWSEWERSTKRLKELMKKKKNSADYICDTACDSYNRYKEDIGLAKRLNNNAIRFGLEWSRIEPKKGTIDIEVINHYREMMAEAKNKGLEIVLTLWHWTNPLWLAKEGGWTNKKVITHYSRYVNLAIKEFGSYVDYWVTLNEPMLLANYSYLLGKFPPQKHSYFKFRKATKNLIAAHKEAYKIIHEHFPKAKVSITNLSNIFEPKRKWFLPDIIFTFIAKSYGLNNFFKKINEYIDYIGIDYYRKIYVKIIPPFMDSKSNKLTDIGWEIYPKGIYYLIKNFRRFKKPILILENGLADKDDKYRAEFIKEHLYWVYKAMEEGADVRGYFHWSLLDNFEWADGYAPKFGLYAVDRQTFERTPRASAQVYAEICKNNKLKIEI